MIEMRTDHNIDRRLAAQDFRPPGLGDTTGNDNCRFRDPDGACAALELAQLAELGKRISRKRVRGYGRC